MNKKEIIKQLEEVLELHEDGFLITTDEDFQALERFIRFI